MFPGEPVDIQNVAVEQAHLMAFVLELYVDAATQARITTLWREMEAASLAAPPAAWGARAHISLIAARECDAPRAVDALAGFARRVPPFTLTLAALGQFPLTPDGGVIFAAPVVGEGLLRLHRESHAHFAGILREPWAYYLPDHWVPHCTLIERCPAERLDEALRLCRRLPLPMTARIETIGIVEVQASRVTTVAAQPLGGPARPAPASE